MAKRKPERREDALSRDRIVDAAIELLDEAGETGLTFRTLAARLATGPGAIYWHVADKTALLVAACDAIVARTMTAVTAKSPHAAIRQIAGGVFDAIDQHPWVGTQLSRAPSPTATLKLFEAIGQQLQLLGGQRRAHFTAASALVSYILGVSIQNAALGRAFDSASPPPIDRAQYLDAEAARWQALDAHAYPFLRSIATTLRNHDDRAEFLAGIDLLLAGIAAR